MRTVNLILISLILLTFSASSCGECRDIKPHKLTEVDKLMIPYKLGQTINFINSMGQPIVLTVIKDTTILWEEEDNCSLYEALSVNLQSELGDLFIGLSIGGEYRCYGTFNSPYNCITIWIEPFIYDILYHHTEGEFVTDTANKQFFYNSFEINGKIYYDVVEHNNSDGMQLFYNKTYGILHVNRDGKNFLTINLKTDEDKENKSLDVVDCFDVPLADVDLQSVPRYK